MITGYWESLRRQFRVLVGPQQGSGGCTEVVGNSSRSNSMNCHLLHASASWDSRVSLRFMLYVYIYIYIYIVAFPVKPRRILFRFIFTGYTLQSFLNDFPDSAMKSGGRCGGHRRVPGEGQGTGGAVGALVFRPAPPRPRMPPNPTRPSSL